MASPPAPASSLVAQEPRRPLWQIPVFFLGVVVLSSYLFWRPLWINPLRAARWMLQEARRELDKSDPDPHRVAAMAQGYLDRAGTHAERSGEAHFLIGSALMRAGRPLPDSAGRVYWRQAREHFEQAEQLGVPDDMLRPLRFRLGLIGDWTGMEPIRVARLLGDSVAGAREDQVLGYRTLIKAHLAAPTPDLNAALKANEELRLLPLLGEDVLGPARVQGGELLLQLRRPTEARRVLEKVSENSDPLVLRRARNLRANSLQDEASWAEAAMLWQELLEDRRSPLKDPGPTMYQLGFCLARLENTTEAKAVWRDCLEKSPSSSAATAAALGLTEVLLGEEDLAGAFQMLSLAVREVQASADWKNEFVELLKVQGLFEKACQLARGKADFDRAAKLARLYERLAVPGQASLLLAQTFEAWALSTQSLAAKPPTQAESPPRLIHQNVISRQVGYALFRQGGEAYLRSAEQVNRMQDRSQRLWLSASCYLRAQDATSAIPVLKRFLEMGLQPDFTGEAWYLLAEAQRWVQQPKDAEKAWRECLKHPGRFALRSRFRLGELELTRGQPDRAKEILQQNLEQLRLDPDPEALEKSLFTLAELQFRQRDYSNAAPLLEEGLTKFPSSSLTTRGRFQLAECYRTLAAQSNVNEVMSGTPAPAARAHHERQHRIWLRRALEQYGILSQGLPGPAGTALTPVEEVQVLFSAAECQVNLGEYGIALKLYQGLVERFKDRPERLSALGGLVRCHAVLEMQARKDQKSADALEHAAQLQVHLDAIRAGLKDLDAMTRQEWEEWLKRASKPL